MIAAIAFYVFALILLASAVMVVSARNPVHSVLFLILAFFNAAALFLLAGAEFLAMILVIVYVGAVAVLFLFVVMMLDINFAELRSGFQRYAPVGLAIGVVLALELFIVLGGWKIAPEAMSLRFTPNAPNVANTAQLGRRALHRLHIPVPDRRARAAGGDDRRDRADAARPPEFPPPEHRAPDRPRAGRDMELVDVRIGAGMTEIGIRRPIVAAPEPAEEPHAHAGHGGH